MLLIKQKKRTHFLIIFILGIVLSARVHPGETVSSFVMKGIIDFLLGDSKEAVMLRD